MKSGVAHYFTAGRLLAGVSVGRLRQHPGRTTLTMFGIALGIAVVVGVTLVNRSVVASFEKTAQHIAGDVNFEVTAPGGGALDEAVVDQVRGVPGVQRALPVIEEVVTVGSPSGERVLLLGVDFTDAADAEQRAYRSESLAQLLDDPVAFLNGKYHVLLSEQLARRLHVRVGDRIPISTPDGVQPFEIWGLIEDEGVGRAFGGSVALMYYQAMQVVYGRDMRVDTVQVVATAGVDGASLRARLIAQLGKAVQVVSPRHRVVRTERLLGGLQAGLTLGSLIALLVGGYLVFNTMRVSVVQRRRELGILRALGARRRDVVRLMMFEALALGLVASVIGLPLGVALAKGMLGAVAGAVSEMYVQTAATHVHLDVVLLVGAALCGVVVSLIAAALPAREAAATSPLEAVRGVGTVDLSERVQKTVHASDLAGGLALTSAIALIGAAPWLGAPEAGADAQKAGLPVAALLSCCLMVVAVTCLLPRVLATVTVLLRPSIVWLFGADGLLACGNLRRDTRRAAVTAAALAIGVGMAVCFGVFVASFMQGASRWIDQSIPADLFITSGARFAGASSEPMSPALYDELREVEGVLDVERFRIVDTEVNGRVRKLIATDSQIFTRYSRMSFLAGDAQTAVAAWQRGDVLVSENLARQDGLRVGDMLELSTPSGPLRRPVAGVIVDYTSDLGTVYLEREDFVRQFRDARVDTFKLYLREGHSDQAVKTIIEQRFGERFRLFVLTNRDFKRELQALLSQVFHVMHALELVAIAIAVMGVANTLITGVLDRMRELGVLRAVGMRRRQVRRMIVLEAGVLATASIVAGVGLGLALGYVMVRHVSVAQLGWSLEWLAPWAAILRTVLCVATMALLAAWYPARRAAGLRIRDALAYE